MLSDEDDISDRLTGTMAAAMRNIGGSDDRPQSNPGASPRSSDLHDTTSISTAKLTKFAFSPVEQASTSGSTQAFGYVHQSSILVHVPVSA